MMTIITTTMCPVDASVMTSIAASVQAAATAPLHPI